MEEGTSQLADVPVETKTEEPQDEVEECDYSKEMQQEEEPTTNENETNLDEPVEEPLHCFVVQSAHSSVQIAMEYGSTQQNNKKRNL